MGDNLDCFSFHLTSINSFSAIIRKKFFIAKEVPPFHLVKLICLAFSVLGKVELVVELETTKNIFPGKESKKY